MDGSDVQETGAAPASAFRHEALLYEGIDDFVEQTSSFIVEGVESGEPVLVVVAAEKIARLRDELGARANVVHFADMLDVGSNPARIIPAWKSFVDGHAGSGQPLRGIGEPIWAGRSAEELIECERHEALLNLAFAAPHAWWLLCPYDVAELPPTVLQEARRNHPFVLAAGENLTAQECRSLSDIAQPFDAPLADAPAIASEMRFDSDALSDVRRFVEDRAAHAGLDALRSDDLVLAVNEIVTNSVRYGGGQGVLKMWETPDTSISEVRDSGHIDGPMIGRLRPTPNESGGFGVWIANQVCDLVQVRSFPDGSTVRLHMRRR